MGISLIPFASILQVLSHPWSYPPGIPFADAVRVADYLALAGLLAGVGLAFLCFARRPSAALRIAPLLFATMALVLGRTDTLQSVYHFGRIYTPMLLCLAAAAAEDRNPWLLAPVAMMLPRLAIQIAPQALGVVRWMA